MAMLSTIATQGQFRGKQTQVGCDSFVPHFSAAHGCPVLPTAGDPGERIKSFSKLIVLEPPFAPANLLPGNANLVEFLQLGYYTAGRFIVEPLREFAERRVAQRLAGDAHQAIDHEASTIGFISEVDRVHIALRSV